MFNLVTACKGYINSEHLPTLLEGLLDFFFGHFNSGQFEHLLHIANETAEIYPEVKYFQDCTPKGLIKYFLRIQLANYCGEEDELNLLKVYNSEVIISVIISTTIKIISYPLLQRRKTLGEAVARRMSEEHECIVYVPTFYHNIIHDSKISVSEVRSIIL